MPLKLVEAQGCGQHLPLSEPLFPMASRLALTDPKGGVMRVESAMLRAVRVARVTSSGHVVGLREDRNATLLLPMQGMLWVEMPDRELAAAAGEALFFTPNQRQTTVDPAGHPCFLGAVVLVPIDELMHRIGLGGGRLAEPMIAHHFAGPAMRPLCAELGAQLRQMLASLEQDQTLLSGVAAQHAAEALLLEMLIALLQQAGLVVRPADAVSDAARDAVRLAEAYMRRHFAEPITLQMLAEAAGTSVCVLQRSYARAKGRTAWAELNDIRLGHARELLMRPEPGDGVTGIARACGIRHFGRFSANYLVRYGELPSHTLRRRQHLRSTAPPVPGGSQAAGAGGIGPAGPADACMAHAEACGCHLHSQTP